MARQETKKRERLYLILLDYAENDPSLVHHRMFDSDISPQPAVQKAVAAARRKVPKPAADLRAMKVQVPSPASVPATSAKAKLRRTQ